MKLIKFRTTVVNTLTIFKESMWNSKYAQRAREKYPSLVDVWSGVGVESNCYDGKG